MDSSTSCNININSCNNNHNDNSNNNNNNNNIVQSSNTSSITKSIVEEFQSRVKIRPYLTADREILSNICRLPHNTNLNTLKAYSISNDYSIRRSMSQNGYMFVAEDKFDNNVLGAICISEKKLMLDGRERIFFYSFDAIVEPKYRCFKILKRLTETASDVYFKHWKLEPIIYGSTIKTNLGMEKYYESSGMVKFIDQIQHAWKVDIQIQHSPIVYNKRFKVWEEKDTDVIKNKFIQYFSKYEMCPVDFEDILLNKYWKRTYFAEYTCDDGRVIEASISIWDQNKVCTLIDINGKEQIINSDGSSNDIKDSNSKLKFLQLYACYTNEKPNDNINLFNELLKYVHNISLKNKIDYLFIGLAKTDPIENQFPLLPGIKSLDFALHFCVLNFDVSLINKLSNKPFFQDPRDYGVVMFHSENDQKNDQILSNSLISSKL